MKTRNAVEQKSSADYLMARNALKEQTGLKTSEEHGDSET